MDCHTFKDLKLSPDVQAAIDEFGFTSLTPVQGACIPLFLKKKDVAAEAVTGSGKTLAFVIPVFEILLKKGPFRKNDVAALIISPTQELAIQIAEVVDVFAKHVSSFTSILLIGGENVTFSVKKLQTDGANIIVATPGRLVDLLSNNYENYNFALSLKSLEILILDEADRLLELGFESSLNTILSALPKQRQTCLFSATQTKDVEDFIRAGLRNPVSVTVKEKAHSESLRTPSTLSNFYMVVDPDKKFNVLVEFLQSKPDEKHMVFFGTCASVDYFCTVLTWLLPHLAIISIHGKMKSKRHKIFSKFKEMTSGIMLCTDVMARGVDIPDVNWVVQFDPPSSASAFVHRCGRTARIGKTGNALVILLPSELTFVNFLRINQNVALEEMECLPAADVIAKVKKIASKHREVYEKGVRSFVSFVRFYTKHECNLLFRLKDLDLGMLASGFGLLKLPRMPELKNKTLPNFQPLDVDVEKIPYSDKNREKSRQQKLKEYKESLAAKRKEMRMKKEEAWSKTKNQKSKRQQTKKRKKYAEESEQELEELARDARLLKKLKQRKITQEEFDEQFECDIA